MNNKMVLEYDVDPDDFTRAGEASSSLKRTLKQMGMPPTEYARRHKPSDEKME